MAGTLSADRFSSPADHEPSCDALTLTTAQDDSGYASAGPPKVSVLMAAHNAAPYIAQSIDSILRQSLRDLELIVVDDASTDATAVIVASFDDPRICLIQAPHNLGPAEARNLGFARVRGTYLAIQDADDISHPTRLARQMEHLDRHPGDVLVAADIRQLHQTGEMVRSRTGGAASSALLDWMMHLGNPLSFSSTMMRVSALRRLPEFLREDRRYAEDYDLYARLLLQGGVFRLPEPLVIYRVHAGSCSARNRTTMIEQTARVLTSIWAPGLLAGQDRGRLADVVSRHIAAGIAAEDAAVLRAARDALMTLTEAFLDVHPEYDGSQRDDVVRHAQRSWEYLVRASLRAGSVTWAAVPRFHVGNAGRLRGRDLVGAAMMGMIPQRIRALLRPPMPPEPADHSAALATPGTAPAAPPVLFVTVILEGGAIDGCAGAAAETEDGRQSAAFALRAQAVFDPFGLRPVYLLDRHVAAQSAALLALRNVQDSGGCGVGAWWQPNGVDDTQEAMTALCRAIEAGTGDAPGFAVADALVGGRPLPAAVRALVGAPVTTGTVVTLAPVLDSPLRGPMGQPDGGVSSRGDLAHAVSLLPNEVAAEAQIVLIRSLLARGERRFFVRLRLRQGDASSALALDRLRRVCLWFFEDLGGLPGDMRTLAGDRRVTT